jgi:hypothetical protein
VGNVNRNPSDISRSDYKNEFMKSLILEVARIEPVNFARYDAATPNCPGKQFHSNGATSEFPCYELPSQRSDRES